MARAVVVSFIVKDEDLNDLIEVILESQGTILTMIETPWKLGYEETKEEEPDSPSS